MQIFRSVHHPRGMTPAAYFAHRLGRPIAVAFLPVMIVTLIAVLEMRDVRLLVYIGFPVALLAAIVWTAYRLRTETAEIAVDGRYAEVRPVRDVLAGKPPRPWQAVLDVRRSAERIQLTVSTSVFTLAVDEWRDAEELLDALARALHDRGSETPDVAE